MNLARHMNVYSPLRLIDGSVELKIEEDTATVWGILETIETEFSSGGQPKIGEHNVIGGQALHALLVHLVRKTAQDVFGQGFEATDGPIDISEGAIELSQALKNALLAITEGKTVKALIDEKEKVILNLVGAGSVEQVQVTISGKI
jgi:hypothetical protein